MDDLRNWLINAEDYRNNFLDKLQCEFPAVLQNYSSITGHNKENDQSLCQWQLGGEILLREIKNNPKFIDSSGEKYKVTLDEEYFEGSLDAEGDGIGRLQKNNKVNGLYDFLAIGKLINGKLEGKINERKSCTFFGDWFYINGIRHGAYRKFNVSKDFQEVGFYKDGNKIAQFCLKYPGGCYFFGEWSIDGLLSDTCSFIYPDLNSAINGKFEIMRTERCVELKLIEGYFGNIVGFNYKNGIHVPQIQINNKTKVKLEISTDKFLCRNPQLSEPYEQKTVYVASSKISKAGEGLFAKRCIEKGKIVSFYNGVRYLKKRSEGGKSYKSSDFRLNLDKFTDIDIPQRYRNLENYRATLGHKVCHTFDKDTLNVKFKNYYHPHFGSIIALVSTRDILTEEEILVNYNYKNIKRAPEWYKDLWKRH